MILGPLQPQKTAGAGGRITLDDLFHAAVAQRPDHFALVDPPHRDAFTTGAPRRLTYATSPFMQAYCRRVAERYLSSQGELSRRKDGARPLRATCRSLSSKKTYWRVSCEGLSESHVRPLSVLAA
jgi:hypothetical protein